MERDEDTTECERKEEREMKTGSVCFRHLQNQVTRHHIPSSSSYTRSTTLISSSFFLFFFPTFFFFDRMIAQNEGERERLPVKRGRDKTSCKDKSALFSRTYQLLSVSFFMFFQTSSSLSSFDISLTFSQHSSTHSSYYNFNSSKNKRREMERKR